MPLPPVYLDHAATTPVRSDVLEAMLPYLNSGSFGNPSSAHRFGRAARAGLGRPARVARGRGAEPGGLYLGGHRGRQPRGHRRGAGRGITSMPARSAVEHKAVLAAAHHVAHLGGEEIVLAVDSDGLLDQDALEAALARSPVVSVMWVNNETGVRQPVEEIARRCAARACCCTATRCRRSARSRWRSTTCPAPCSPSPGTRSAPPRASGRIVRDRKAVEAIIHTAASSSGSVPVPKRRRRRGPGPGRGPGRRRAVHRVGPAGRARDSLLERLRAVVPDLVVHGLAAPRAPHVLSIGIPGTDSEALLMHLDLAGVAASGGSACSTGAMEPSHVLAAMGVPRPRWGSIRLSLGMSPREPTSTGCRKSFRGGREGEEALRGAGACLVDGRFSGR